MSNLLNINTDYKQWISELSTRFRQSQIKAAIRVNSEMLKFYWFLGRDIVEMEAESKWGNGFFKNLSDDLKDKFPDSKCFSDTNIRYTKRFYLLYNQYITIYPQLGGKLENQILPQLGAELQSTDNKEITQFLSDLFSIPWGHHKCIIDKCNGNLKKAVFFVQETINNNWSRGTLQTFLATDLFERQGMAISNFKNTLPDVQGDLAQQITKDPYNFDFLTITEGFKEKELKNALQDNITKLLLELGQGFAFIGKEYRIMIGKTEKFIDMLFYHTKLHCYVVIELKTNDFDSSNVGQLGTYVVAVNHLLKTGIDNPTIGLLICKDKDNVLAQYSLEATNQPLGISNFELSKVLPENFRCSLPSIEEIENGLRNN